MILNYADHIVFNTPGQVLKYGEKVKSGKRAGLRLNPEFHAGGARDL